MLVGAKVCDLTEDLLWFVCGFYVGILKSPLTIESLGKNCVSYLNLEIFHNSFSWFCVNRVLLLTIST